MKGTCIMAFWYPRPIYAVHPQFLPFCLKHLQFIHRMQKGKFCKAIIDQAHHYDILAIYTQQELFMLYWWHVNLAYPLHRVFPFRNELSLHKNECYYQCFYALVDTGSSSPSHLWPYWPCMKVISVIVPHRDAWQRFMTYTVRFNSEDQGPHGNLCFYLLDIIYILILKCRIPLRTLIFMPYDSLGISIIDPVTGSSVGSGSSQSFTKLMHMIRKSTLIC